MDVFLNKILWDLTFQQLVTRDVCARFNLIYIQIFNI